MTHVRTTVEPSEATAVSHEQWATELADFTHRNEGRRGTLEIDDPELDGQAQLFDYPFLGAAYDPHDQRVELMFGAGTAGGRHLTRAVGGVTSIMIVRDETQRDLAIRIAHGAGLTLLTFTS
jgi:hypothetical protein